MNGGPAVLAGHPWICPEPHHQLDHLQVAQTAEMLQRSVSVDVELVDVDELGVAGQELVELLEGSSPHGGVEPGLELGVVVAAVRRLGEGLGGGKGLVGAQRLQSLFVNVAISGVVFLWFVLLWG